MAQPGGGQRPYLSNPPELPAIAGMNARLADYLRTFALWCQGNFNSTLQKRSATGELFIQSTTGGSVWSITIDDNGLLHATQLTPGSADPGATHAFAPVTGHVDSIVVNPAGTTSATYVMMGLNVQLTSVVATAATVCLDGQITNSSNNQVTECVICYGTGTPPVNGAAQTGTIASQPARYKATSGGDYVPFSITCLIENLTGGNTYWLDAAVRAPSGGTASITDLDFTVVGLA
jgi:hypothetical protein